VFLVNGAHQGGGRWKDFIDEDEDCFLGTELYAFADNIDELSNSEVGGNQVLLLVDSRNVGFLDLLADDGDAVRVLLSDAFSFSLTLLKGMLVLKLGSHDRYGYGVDG